MFRKNWKKEIFTIPNVLSFFRLALIPVYMDIYLNAEEPSHYYLAAAILAVSCLTDMIDGQIARKFHMTSTLGKLLDPIADKLTQLALIVCLSIQYPLLRVSLLLLLCKELFQAIAASIMFRRGKALPGAILPGKICTTVLFVSLIVLVMMPQLSETVIFAITTLDCVVVLIAFICYARVYYTHSPMIQDLEPSQDEQR